MEKDDVIAVLREMAGVLEIADANAFEVMAYRNGAQSLEEWPGDLRAAVSGSALTTLPSIGKGLAKLITELVETGASAERDRVRGLVPPGLPILLRVRGLGPKRVRTLWRDLGIEGPDDLRRAAEEGRVHTLRGFGAKTVERIVSGLEYAQQAPARRNAQAKVDTLPTAARGEGRIYAGTSGYSYSQWKGSFYPEDARADDFLEHYAKRLSTVEINNTFYRFPSSTVLEQWFHQTPDAFRFAMKMHRRVTHQLRLGAAARDHMLEFVQRCAELQTKLGCILFQLPPDFSRDDARLDELLNCLPPGPRYAIEFRHPSWFAREVQDKLLGHNVACVAGDGNGQEPRRVVTADFIYTRLRRGDYSESDLAGWDQWFRAQAADERDVMVYLKHDERGEAPLALVRRWADCAPPRKPKSLRRAPSSSTRKTTRRKSG